MIFLATPEIFTGEECFEEMEAKMRQMLRRARATDAFLKGEISPEDFEEILEINGVDVIQAAEDWDAGLVY